MQDDDFPTIHTGNGFQNDLIATTNDRTKKQVQATRELHGAITELNQSIQKFSDESTSQTKELISLTKSIKEFNQESSAQTDKLIKLTGAIKKSNTEASVQTQKLIDLTKWIVVLTVVLVVGLIVQLVTAFMPHH